MYLAIFQQETREDNVKSIQFKDIKNPFWANKEDFQTFEKLGIKMVFGLSHVEHLQNWSSNLIIYNRSSSGLKPNRSQLLKPVRLKGPKVPNASSETKLPHYANSGQLSWTYRAGHHLVWKTMTKSCNIPPKKKHKVRQLKTLKMMHSTTRILSYTNLSRTSKGYNDKIRVVRVKSSHLSTSHMPRSRTLDLPWNAHGLDLFWDHSSSSSIRSENIEGLSLKQRRKWRGGVYWVFSRGLVEGCQRTYIYIVSNDINELCQRHK